ncbi:MAG: phosphomethylpyrimidine kinase [Chloroflexi bacterium]|nr:phosphomethylpyrimidine kinase [Chloroflexota bacterium]
MEVDRLRENVLGNLLRAVRLLEDCREFAALMPEVRSNLVYALPGAKTPGDVAAIEGRITVVRGLPRASGLPGWGTSDHMARVIIEANRYDNTLHAGVNFRCDARIKEVVKSYCAAKGLTYGWIDRTKEPEAVMEPDGASMPWKIDYLHTQYGGIPRVFYEGEGWGKEPLFFALGADAVEAATMAIGIARRNAELKDA